MNHIAKVNVLATVLGNVGPALQYVEIKLVEVLVIVIVAQDVLLHVLKNVKIIVVHLVEELVCLVLAQNPLWGVKIRLLKK